MIGAVVLAAGCSERMGRPKMILPWGKTTVIEQVTNVLLAAGVDDVLVVTGGAREDVENALAGLPVRTVFNPDFGNGEMILTLQVGLTAFKEDVNAALVVLGDQPQMELSIVKSILTAYHQSSSRIVVPSFQSRRGHPWLVDRDLWEILLAKDSSMTMRNFLNQYNSYIQYLNVDTPTILQDLDTPEDYLQYQIP